MTYKQFCQRVRANNWTAEQLRCDVPPSEELLELMDEIGLNRYETFVMRYTTLDAVAVVQ